MAIDYIIYTDESEGKGILFSNFFGGALLDIKNCNHVNLILQEKKNDLNICYGEMKWEKVSVSYLEKYCEFTDTYFDLIAEGLIKIRIMFTQNINAPQDLDKYHSDREYYMLYYQFLKHIFGLQYGNPSSLPINLHLMIDQLPKNSLLNKEFKDFIVALNDTRAFRDNHIRVSRDEISEVDSKKHVILQGVDIITGAMQFRLNKKHLAKPIGQHMRGKKTIAKEKLYKHILIRIKKLRSEFKNFNIGISTGCSTMNLRYEHPYRHWLFVPSSSKKASEKWKRPI